MARVLRKVRESYASDNSRDRNLFNDQSQFEVKLPDGIVDRLNANAIAENPFSQVDKHGHQFQLLNEIIEHRNDDSAIPIEHGYMTSRSGNWHPKKTTQGWKLLVEWKDGTVSWVPFKDMKASNPVQVAEYEVANNIDWEPAFNW